MANEKCFIYDHFKDDAIQNIVLQIEFFTAKNWSYIRVCFTFSDIEYACMDKSKSGNSTRVEDSQTNVDVSISEVNIVQKRNTRSVKCISSGYNSWIKDNIIDYIGCTPPFWDGFTDKKCNKTEAGKYHQLKICNLWYKFLITLTFFSVHKFSFITGVLQNRYTPPCTELEVKATFEAKGRNVSLKNPTATATDGTVLYKRRVYFKVVYLVERFQLIQQMQGHTG